MVNKDTKAKNTTVLVTGGTGFVGSHLIKELCEQKVRIKCLIRKETSATKLQGKNIEVFIGDIRNKKSLEKCVRKIDVVVHLAGIKKGNRWREFYESNVLGTKNLIGICEKGNGIKFMFMSSLNVKLPITNWYSVSKIEAEKIVLDSNLPATIIRPSLIYGSNDKGMISMMIRNISRSFFTPILGRGQHKIQPVYVKDIVKLILEIVKKDRFEREVFTVGGGSILTYNEVVDIICQKLNVRRMKIFIPFSVVRVGIMLGTACFGGKFSDVEERLKTYPFDKITDNRSIFKSFHLRPLSFEKGLAEMMHSPPFKVSE